jgi:hypothetical protein
MADEMPRTDLLATTSYIGEIAHLAGTKGRISACSQSADLPVLRRWD